MQPVRRARGAEQHDAEEPGFQEKGAQHLVAHQGSENGAGPIGKDAPVRAELVAHHQARHDPHAEGHSKDLYPVFEESKIDIPFGPEPKTLQNGEIAGKTDSERRKNDMKRDGEGELHPGQHRRVEPFEHCPVSMGCGIDISAYW